MLDSLSQYLLTGNTDIFLFIIFTFLCIGPLILIWKSTYVADRPINVFINATPSSRSNIAAEVSETFSASSNIQSTSQPLPTASVIPDDVASNLSSENIQSNEEIVPGVASNIGSSHNTESISTSRNNDSQTSNLRQRHAPTDASLPKLLPGQSYIRLKYLDETIQTVPAKPSDTIGELKQKAFPPHLISRYRIIFKGNVLRSNNQTIRDCGILPEQPDASSNREIPVLHCFLSPESDTRSQAASPSNSQTSLDDLNVGNFFLPLFGSILAFLWYLCVFHTALFTIPSLFGIIGLTCFFVVILVNRYI